MSNPLPPDRKSPQTSSSSTPQPHPSLPARPPPPVSASFKPAFSAAPSSTSGAPGTGSYGQGHNPAAASSGGFTTFKPRSVATPTENWRSNSPNVSSGPYQPPTSYNAYQQQPQPQYGYGQQQQYQHGYSQQQQQYSQPYGAESYGQPTPPQIRNPFPLPAQASQQNPQSNVAFDPEMDAQIAQWNMAYAPKDEATTQKGTGQTGPNPAGGANATALGARSTQPTTAALSNQEVAAAAKSNTGVASVVAGPDGKEKTVVRSGGGQTWQDPTLLEWDPAHFRLFVGNLAGEVTDDSLLKAFSKYESVQKARVVRDKRTTKSKGYGFVSFSSGDQYFQAAKEMQGKYIGSHPVLLRRSTTEIKPTAIADKNSKNNKKGHKGDKGGKEGRGESAHNANTGAGISKKQPKTKNGLKLLG